MNIDKLKDNVFKLMVQNRRFCDGYQYTVPSPENYPYQWLWDSCFHAIILSYYNLEDAKKELLSLVSHQFENGMIPHMIYWDKASPTDFPVIEWGKKDTSTITQPPMLVYAAWKIFQKDGRKDFLKEIYPYVARFYQYLLTDRRGEDGLVGIINPDESGEDNSPRFDEPLGLPPVHDGKLNFGKRLELVGKNISCNFETKECMSNFFWVKDVPFNAIMVENLFCLSEIAAKLGNRKDSAFFQKERTQIIKAMKKLMLENGIFWSTYDRTHKKIKVKTWAIFAPLFASLYTQNEAENIVKKYLLNNDFNLAYTVPTVAKEEPSYNPKGFWRGPIWIATNWFIYKGLLNYGFSDAASKILKSSLNLIRKSGVREQFSPETGEGLGAKNFTWGGLILDMN